MKIKSVTIETKSGTRATIDTSNMTYVAIFIATLATKFKVLWIQTELN